MLDLFSGCGGLSLGFARAGALISAGVEQDSDAAASHAANFHNGALLHRRARDITRTAPEALIGELGLGDPACAIDILVGGPPCQAFARVGRPKLREIYEHKQAFRRDPRALLYLGYLHYVDALAPLGVRDLEMPATPERVWRALRAARQG